MPDNDIDRTRVKRFNRDFTNALGYLTRLYLNGTLVLDDYIGAIEGHAWQRETGLSEMAGDMAERAYFARHGG